MDANDLVCQISGKASDAIASVWALLVYVLARIIMWRTIDEDTITLILSDAAMVLLLLLAAEQSRQGKETERTVKAIADSDPKVDV